MSKKKRESVILTYVATIPPEAADNDFTQYAVVFSPKTENTNALQKTIEAGGFPVRSTFFDFIVITASKDHEYPLKVKEQGALMVLSPIIKGGCYIENKSRLSKQTQGL
jgi:hypothetical protein